MARVYSGEGGTVDINPPDLARLINDIVKSVTIASKIAAKKSLLDIREIVQGGIRDNTLGLNPLKQSTLTARAMGKTAGNFPARNKYAGIAPLNASGQTLRGIKINSDMLSLGFDEDATITYTNGNMQKVAEKQESGFTIRGTYSKKMLAYLHILFKKQFGERAKNNSGAARLGVAYTRAVEPRPAWERATQRAVPRIENNFATAIIDELAKKGLV